MTNPRQSLGTEARHLVRALHDGVLSTLSKRLAGYPFASVCPFVLDDDAQPIILVSNLAEHSKNLGADPRVSLLAHVRDGDLQAGARVTLVGEAVPVERQSRGAQRYLRYLPQAEGYFSAHDFYFLKIQVQHIRYIGGFGKIHWIQHEDYAPARAEALIAAEAGILHHMNTDHGHNLRDYCQQVHGVAVDTVAMVGIDPEGFDLLADGQLLRFGFSEPIADAQEARQRLVALAHRCTKANAEPGT